MNNYLFINIVSFTARIVVQSNADWIIMFFIWKFGTCLFILHYYSCIYFNGVIQFDQAKTLAANTRRCVSRLPFKNRCAVTMGQRWACILSGRTIEEISYYSARRWMDTSRTIDPQNKIGCANKIGREENHSKCVINTEINTKWIDNFFIILFNWIHWSNYSFRLFNGQQWQHNVHSWSDNLTHYPIPT